MFLRTQGNAGSGEWCKTAMKPDQERVKQMLTETILLLCKNGLHFQKQMTVQGLLGVTLDNTDIFMIHLNEVIHPEANPDICDPDATEVCAEIATLDKASPAFRSDSPFSDIACIRRDNTSTVSTLVGFHEVGGNPDLPEDRVHVKSEPTDHSVEMLDSSQGISQSNTWPRGYSSGVAPTEDSARLGESIDCMVTFDPIPLSMGPKDERLLSGQRCSSLTTAQYNDDDFQNDFISHDSRHDLQNPLSINSDSSFTSTHNPSQSRLTSRPNHKSYSLANQFPTSHFFVSRYRPKNSTDKEYHCTYPDCTLSFYARRTLLRHQTQKHGRPKSYVRYGSKPYGLSSIQYARSCDAP